MNATEQATLKALRKILKNSALKTWQSGDVDDWCDYAKKMRTSIQASLEIFDELIKLPPEEDEITL